jgi:alpha-tubulin suppressor-like RCC1 family protein
MQKLFIYGEPTKSIPNWIERTTFHYTIKHIACGAEHVVIVTNDNQVFSMGNNSYGQLAVPENTFNTTEDTQYDWQENFVPVTNLPSNIKDYEIIALRTGPYHTVLVTDQNEIWAVGANSWNELGIQEQPSFCSFKQIPIEKGVFTDMGIGGGGSAGYYHSIIVLGM